MMKTTNQSPRCARASSTVLRYASVFLLCAALVAAQGRITKPPGQTNSNSSAKRTHVATLRSSDSSEGSRVALSSDQSLNDYEAYRRGDRFYVKIPAADVSRADAIRGRGFADVKAQRNGDSTVVSFRLQPGASARVEQRSNRLDVVFTVPGGGPASASNVAREPSKRPEPNRNSNANTRNPSPAPANKNSADRSSSAAARNQANSNVSSKTGSPSTLASNSASKPIATPLPSPKASPSVKTPSPSPTPTAASTKSSFAQASPTTQATPAASPVSVSRQDSWSRMKERINYWILLAQLNPLPVAVGLLVLFLLFALFLFQRRRAKAPRRAKTSAAKSTRRTTTRDAAPTKDAPSDVQTSPDSKPVTEVMPPIAEAAVLAGAVAVAPKAEPVIEAVNPPVVSDAATPLVEDSRRDQIAQVNEEAKKLTNGTPYDESVIGSNDPATRQLVGAELLSAMVGRSETRRQYARDAFMKHGYFDDATRDLRTAESANERAAAARRLSFVSDREATPHLVGALDDPSPDVRRTAVEALMDLRDPAAIGPLNSLMQTENDRKVPRAVIKQAIEACATAAPESLPSVATPIDAPQTSPVPSSQPIETEREVIEL